MTNSKTFGGLLRELRIKHKKTISELAKLLDVSVVYISDVERGKRNPFDEDKINKISSFLKIDATDLLNQAAMDKKTVELSLEDKNNIHSKTALALARKWDSITEDELNEIFNILTKEE